MRHKEFLNRFPALKWIVIFAATAGLGLVGYEVAVKTSNVLNQDLPRPYEQDGWQFPDIFDLADSLEEDIRFEPRFLMHHVPELFVNSLPDICSPTSSPETLAQLVDQTPELGLNASGSGEKLHQNLFSVYASRSTCRDGQASFTLSFSLAGRLIERQTFTDDASGREAMLGFIRGHFQSLHRSSLPSFSHLYLCTVTDLPVEAVAETLEADPHDPVVEELGRLALGGGQRLSSETITGLRLIKRWSRAYHNSPALPAPFSMALEVSFQHQSGDFFGGPMTVYRFRDRFFVSWANHATMDIDLDPSLYPNLYAFLATSR